jgi:hypothetical protein
MSEPTGVVTPHTSTSDSEVNELISFMQDEGGDTTNKSDDNGVSGNGSTALSQPDASKEESSTPPAKSIKESEAASADDSDSDYSPREKALLKRIEELTQAKLDSGKSKESDSSEEEYTPQEHNFLADLDLDDVLSNSDNLNKLLVAVYNKAVQDGSKRSAEGIMRTLPNTMSNYVSNHLSMRELVNQFYSDNPDLKDAKKTVTDVANQLANENPELSVEEVFAKTGEKVREVLNLKKIEPKSNEKPTLHTNRGNGGRNRLQIPELNGLAKEIDDLLT